MSGTFMAFLWGLSLLAAVLMTSLLQANKLWGILLGTLFSLALIFVGGHVMGLSFGPVVNIGGTETSILANIVLAVIGALIGAGIARAIRRGR